MIRTTWHGRMEGLQAQSTSMGSRIAKLNEQVATGKRINRPSDDPGRISQLHNIRQELSNQDVYIKNASQAEQLLNVAEQSIKDIHITLTEARETAVQFANESYNGPQRAEAANVVSTLFERALNSANVKFNERYIFAGTSYDAPAYDSTGAYDGSGDTPETVVGDGLTVDTGFAGNSVLTDSSDMFVAMEDLEAALNANDTVAITASLDAIDDALQDVEEGMVNVGGQMRRSMDAIDLASNLEIELTSAKVYLEETNVVEAYSKLVQLQTNFDAAMQVTSMQRYSGLFARI
jgi:flagellar hook-associated protein 3 FlgL